MSDKDKEKNNDWGHCLFFIIAIIVLGWIASQSIKNDVEMLKIKFEQERYLLEHKVPK